ncbi:MAG: hypothetical protein E7111_02080 [Bacteroidales bacterium]|nr:hypothetical protein [Bacteroidales bacterium]
MKKIQLIFALIIAISLTGCQPDEPAGKSDVVAFTVRFSEVSHDYAIINVKHNGPEDLIWYGFLTEEVTEKNYSLYTKKRRELLAELSQDGKIKGLKQETERNILLEDLKENTKYKYVVFGIQENGEAYRNVSIGSIEFETGQNAYLLQETKDWEISYAGRSEDGTKDLIEVKANKGGRFAWQYIKKETIEEWNKEYKNGYEVWEDDIYMNTLDGLQMFTLQEISTIQYYVVYLDHKLTDFTYVYEEGKPFEIDRLASGDYYFVAYGFNGDGSHTRTYSVQEIKIEEEAATEGYDKWLGNYSFTGKVNVTNDEGEVVEETRTYNLFFEKYDNNFMYRVHGWECGEDVEYDWEVDITQIDKEKGQFLAFPAYYQGGNLVIKEQPITYITFDGATSLKMGMYGYAFNEQYGEHMPTLFDGNIIAVAEPVAEGENSTTLVAQDAEYHYTDENGKEKVLEWTYSRMGYVAYNENVEGYPASIINPAMKLPITITRTEDDAPAGGNIATGGASSAMKATMFETKTISTDFLRKDYRPAEKVRPAVFQRLK